MTLDTLVRGLIEFSRGLIREAVREEWREMASACFSPANDNAHPADAPMTTAAAARYCGFKSTAAIRKAFRDGRLTPIGRRGGTGTYMWSRLALEAFLAGSRSDIVPAGRPGANPARVGGTHGNEMGQAMGQLDSTDAGQTRRLPQKGGRIPGPGSRHRSADGETERDQAEPDG